MANPKQEDQLSDEVTTLRADAALKRALTKPHKPHVENNSKSDAPKSVRKRAIRKKAPKT